MASPPCSTVRRKCLPPSLRLFRSLASFYAGGRCRLDSVGGNFGTCTIFTLPASGCKCLAAGDPPKCFEQAHPLPPSCAFSQSYRRDTPPPSRLGGIYFGFNRFVGSSVSTISFIFISKNSFTNNLCIFFSSSNFSSYSSSAYFNRFLI